MPRISIFSDIERWANDRNLILGSTPKDQFVKLAEEVGELASCVAKGKPLEEVVDAIGDSLVVLTIISAQHNVNVLSCAEAAYLAIANRKGRMVDGVFVKEEDLK